MTKKESLFVLCLCLLLSEQINYFAAPQFEVVILKIFGPIIAKTFNCCPTSQLSQFPSGSILHTSIGKILPWLVGSFNMYCGWSKILHRGHQHSFYASGTYFEMLMTFHHWLILKNFDFSLLANPLPMQYVWMNWVQKLSINMWVKNLAEGCLTNFR